MAQCKSCDKESDIIVPQCQHQYCLGCWREVKETAKSEFVTLCCNACALQAIKCGQKRSYSEGDETELPTKQRRGSEKSISLNLQCNKSGTPIALNVSMVGFGDEADSGVESSGSDETSELGDVQATQDEVIEDEVKREEQEAEENREFLGELQQMTDGMEQLQFQLFDELDGQAGPMGQSDGQNEEGSPSAKNDITPEEQENILVDQHPLHNNTSTPNYNRVKDESVVSTTQIDSEEPSDDEDDEDASDENGSSDPGDSDKIDSANQEDLQDCDDVHSEEDENIGVSLDQVNGGNSSNHAHDVKSHHPSLAVDRHAMSPTAVGQMLVALSQAHTSINSSCSLNINLINKIFIVYFLL